MQEQSAPSLAQELVVAIAQAERAAAGARLRQAVADVADLVAATALETGIVHAIERDLAQQLLQRRSRQRAEQQQQPFGAPALPTGEMNKSKSNDDGDDRKQHNNNTTLALRWCVVVEELRTVKKKRERELSSAKMRGMMMMSAGTRPKRNKDDEDDFNNKKATGLGSERTLSHIFPTAEQDVSKISEQYQLLQGPVRDSFGIVHFLVDANSIAQTFPEVTLSPLMLLKSKVRRNDNQKGDDDDDDDLILVGGGGGGEKTSRKTIGVENEGERVMSLIWKGVHKKQSRTSEDSTASATAGINQRAATSKLLLQSTEWLQVDCALLQKTNGGLMRHQSISRAFCGDCLLLHGDENNRNGGATMTEVRASALEKLFLAAPKPASHFSSKQQQQQPEMATHVDSAADRHHDDRGYKSGGLFAANSNRHTKNVSDGGGDDAKAVASTADSAEQQVSDAAAVVPIKFIASSVKHKMDEMFAKIFA